ncbi:S26 family signal peptidase, partial [Streptomyces hundungensis]|uniref:S26 family signal peptidase n=1 Tax=Streptomyces hundungensis TaxID=1077946 RepID=UPI00340251B8
RWWCPDSDRTGPASPPDASSTSRYSSAECPRHPLQQDLLIVKRLMELREGGWWVLGDNTDDEAVDSRAFGAVPVDLVLGRVRGRFRPMTAGRRRTLGYVASWALASVRPVLSDRSVSRRLRAR